MQENNDSRPTDLAVYVVEDHQETREELCRHLNQEEGICLIGSTAYGQEAFEALQAHQGSLILLLDLNLPDTTGWDLLNRLQSLEHPPKCLILSVKDEQFFCRRLLKAGARGYLMKGASYSAVSAAIRQVAAGYIVVSPKIATELIEEALHRTEVEQRCEEDIEQLSDRELQVLDLIVRGKRNKDIAIALSLSDKTVATYKTRLMRKLDVVTTPELLNAAQRFFKEE